MTRIGDIVNIIKGSKAEDVYSSPVAGSYPYLQIEQLRDELPSEYATGVNPAIATPEDVVIAWDGANAGTVGFGLNGLIGSTLVLLRSKVEIHTPYLGYFLRSMSAYLREHATGATIPHLSRGVLENLELSLPPLAEQRRIAAILRAADEERRRRRYTQTLSDGLLGEVFTRMFGDGGSTAFNAPLLPLSELCTLVTDGTHQTPQYQSTGVPFLSVKNITQAPEGLDFGDVKYISRQEHESIWKRCPVKNGDILYTKVGSYGIPRLVETDREFSIFVSVALLRPDTNQVVPKYLELALSTRFVKTQADRLVSGIGVPDLHLREIKTILVPLPPLDLQRQFATIAAEHERVRRQQQESARQSEHLFEALLGRAFAGEL